MDGINVAGVQFRRAGRIYDFSVGENLSLKVGDEVVVETERGPSLAKVAVVRFVDRSAFEEQDLKPVVRLATSKDLEESGKLSPEKAVSFAKEKVEKLQLEMHVLQADVQFGGNKVIIYFTAPGRVDFRELVKELAGGLKARVELKQIGARDEAKLVGGLGICGREYCCASWLRDFIPVSIKMAKNQNLALNPSKVSGGCGRLLCCLTYENAMYVELRKRLPNKGTKVRILADNSNGVITKPEFLSQSVWVSTEDGKFACVPISEVEILKPGSEISDASDVSEVDEAEVENDIEEREAQQFQEDKPAGDVSESPRGDKGQPDEGKRSPEQGASRQAAEGERSGRNKRRRRGRRNRNRNKNKQGSSQAQGSGNRQNSSGND